MIYIFSRPHHDIPLENPTYLTTSTTPSRQYSALGPRDTPTTNRASRAICKSYEVPIQTKGPLPEGEVGEATFDPPTERPEVKYEMPIMNNGSGASKDGHTYNVLQHK